MKKESEWQQGGGSGSVDWDRHQRAEAPWYALSSCAFGSLWDFGDTGYQFSVVGWETPARAVSSFRSAVPAWFLLSPFVTLVLVVYGGWGRTTLTGHMC